MWYSGVLNSASIGCLGDGFELRDPAALRPSRRKKYKDRSHIFFCPTNDAQGRVLIASGEKNRRGYSLRTVTGHLASCIIDTEYEVAPSEISEILDVLSKKLLVEQDGYMC